VSELWLLPEVSGRRCCGAVTADFDPTRTLPHRSECVAMLSRSPFPDDLKRCPIRWYVLRGSEGSSRYASMARRSASARPSDGSGFIMSKVDCRKPHRCVAVHCPVRHKKRAGTGIERLRKAGERLRIGLVAHCGIARRENDPIRVELKLRNLAGRQQAIVRFTRLLRQCQHHEHASLAVL
jgi:hypothetical protein